MRVKAYLFLQLINYNEQDEYGDMSAKIYVKQNVRFLSLNG